jgi:hypothetical protein
MASSQVGKGTYMTSLRKCFGLVVVTGLLCAVAYCQDAAKADAAPAAAPAAQPAAAPAEEGKPVDAKDVQDKLVPLTDMENAFKRTWATRVNLSRQVTALEQKLKDTADEEAKKEIRKNIGEARKNLQTLAVAMEVIFGVGRMRAYEYDEVKSTIFLRVGTAEEVFVRAIKARDAYGKLLVEKKAEADKEGDAEKKKELEKNVEELTKRYQIVAAALHQVYGVTPKRAYSYNPKNSTLYLKVSENELAKIKEQLEKLQEERKAKEGAKEGAAEGAAAPAPAAEKK